MTYRSLILLIILAVPANAGLVTVSTSAEVTALFDSSTPDIDSSTANSGTLAASQSGNNSLTNSDITYAYDGVGMFSGNALIVAEKTVNARPGGPHTGTAEYSFTFTTDMDMDFTLGGTWGFDGADGSSDSLNYILQDSGGTTISSGSTNSVAGVSSAGFSDSGSLSAGTYTFLITAELNETINNQGIAQAGWDLTEFTLTAGTPEPSSLSLLILGISFCGSFRRKRKPPVG